MKLFVHCGDKVKDATFYFFSLTQKLCDERKKRTVVNEKFEL